MTPAPAIGTESRTILSPSSKKRSSAGLLSTIPYGCEHCGHVTILVAFPLPDRRMRIHWSRQASCATSVHLQGCTQRRGVSGRLPSPLPLSSVSPSEQIQHERLRTSSTVTGRRGRRWLPFGTACGGDLGGEGSRESTGLCVMACANRSAYWSLPLRLSVWLLLAPTSPVLGAAALPSLALRCCCCRRRCLLRPLLPSSLLPLLSLPSSSSSSAAAAWMLQEGRLLSALPPACSGLLEPALRSPAPP